ncbi:oligosaccharide flippase family protein (plasmid) [Sphingomonas aurantiaca]
MSVSRHSVYNLAGSAVPVLLALGTVPAYLTLIGADRFGILSIAWLILGYFGLFDLGLGRAAAQRIAALKDADPAARRRAFATALAANLVVGVLGAAVLWPVGWMVFGMMNMAPALRDEALTALPWLALSVPVATTLGVLSGVLMGRERFAVLNRAGIVSTVLFQLLPLGVALTGRVGLPALLAACVVARGIGLAMFWRACRTEFGGVTGAGVDWAELRGLMSYGGWVTVGAMFGPLLVIADRFLIGVVLNTRAVAIYTVPMQVTQRLGAVPAALGNALFPRLATARGDEAQRLSRAAVGTLLAVLSPPVAAGILLFEPAMTLWVGDAIGTAAAPIGRILLIAAWLNAFAQIPYVRLQAQGRPDAVTWVLLAQIPFYLGALWFALHGFGLMGAAVVYLVRVAVDHVALFLIAGKQIDHGVATAILGAGLLVLAILPAPPLLIAVPTAVGVALAILFACRGMLPPAIVARLRLARGAAA